jgi:hypothetical protein
LGIKNCACYKFSSVIFMISIPDLLKIILFFPCYRQKIKICCPVLSMLVPATSIMRYLLISVVQCHLPKYYRCWGVSECFLPHHLQVLQKICLLHYYAYYIVINLIKCIIRFTAQCWHGKCSFVSTKRKKRRGMCFCQIMCALTERFLNCIN